MCNICYMCIYIYIYIYIYMSSRHKPLHLSSCYCDGYHFWGGPIAFQGFVEISIFEILSCMHLPFMCIHVLSFSFHVPFIGIQFHSFSFHIPFIFIPMCIYVPSSSFHLHAFSFHFVLMSFHFLSKVMEMALWLGQGTECNKWLSLSYR